MSLRQRLIELEALIKHDNKKALNWNGWSFSPEVAFMYTKITDEISKIVADHFKDHDIRVVASIGSAGAIFSAGVCLHLLEMRGFETICVHSKNSGPLPCNFAFYETVMNHIIKNSGKKTLVVADSLGSGEHIRTLVNTLIYYKLKVPAVATVCNPRNVTPEFLGVEEIFSVLETI